MENWGEVTCLLQQIALGDRNAQARLMSLIYADLRQIAARYMARERANHTLQPTALVHEVYLRLAGTDSPHWKNRAHFYAVAAKAMKRILIDHARNHCRKKRGGGNLQFSINDLEVGCQPKCVDVMALHEALERLASIDSRQSHIVELRFFGGLSEDEVAEVLRISPRTVRREWLVARAWLFGDLKATHRTNGCELGQDKEAV